jgi:hypothetical protein
MSLGGPRDFAHAPASRRRQFRPSMAAAYTHFKFSMLTE